MAEGASSPRSLEDLPGPDGLPLLGNALQLPSDRLHRVLEEWAGRFGSLYTIRLGSRRALVTADPALAQQALRERPETFSRISNVEAVAAELGMDGLFSAEGERWRRLRRLWIAALNAAQIKTYFPRLTEITGRLLARWQRASARGEAIDVQADLMRYTVDVSVLFALGHDANTLGQDGDVIQHQLHQVMAAAGRRFRSAFPYWRYVRLPADRRLARALPKLRATVQGLIDQARARIAANPALAQRPTNLLEALLVTRDEHGAVLSDADIFGNTMTLLLAGEDTTANTLAWMMHFLAEHPETQAALRAEVDAVVGDAPLWTDPAQADRFRYVEGVMSEALRLKPVAPTFFLTALKDVELGGVHVPAGTVVIISMRVAALDEARFEHAHAFRPERWLDDTPHAYAQRPPMPFGSGPRVCPGRNLAVTEVKSVAAMLARHFEIEPAPGPGPVDEVLNFTLQPVNLRLRLKPRA